DHVRDRGSVRRLDAALHRADDAGRDRAVEAERVADRDDLIADPHAVRAPERQRLERTRLDVHLEHGDVGRRIDSDHLRLEALVVREADLDNARSLDDVVVRDDVAGLVDDEARAERALRLGRAERIAEERIRGLAYTRGRLDVHDRRRGSAVDLVDRTLL